MKIQFLNNTKFNITNEKDSMVKYFSGNNLSLVISEKSVNIPVSTVVYKTVPGFNGTTGNPQMVKYIGIDNITKSKIVADNSKDIIIFVREVGQPEPDIVFTNWSNAIKLGGSYFIEIIINKYLQDTGKVSLAIKHEIMHSLCFYLNGLGYRVRDEMDTDNQGRAFYLNDEPNNPLSNFGQTWNNIKPFLNIISNTPQNTFPVLRIGSKGEEVKELQILLGITADGNFGDMTFKVLTAFQRTNKLVADGICGKLTWLSLKKKPKIDLSKWKLSLALRPLAEEFLTRCESKGHNIGITSGRRTQEEQNTLYEQGRTTPGNIVTWTKDSNHIGGNAFDIAFIGNNPYPKGFNWEILGKIGEEIGLKWGGRWKKPDNPHFELKK